MSGNRGLIYHKLLQMSEPIYIGGILLSEENYLAVRKAYRKAVAEKLKAFEFQGHPWVTQYIKYVLELMETYPIIKPLINQPDE